MKYILLGRGRLLRDLAPLVDHLLVSGPSELAEVQTEFPELRSADIRIVPHPVEISEIDVPDINPYEGTGWRRHFFVGGRIKSRKNQNAVLRVAARVSDSEFVFAGQLNETDPAYCAESAACSRWHRTADGWVSSVWRRYCNILLMRMRLSAQAGSR